MPSIYREVREILHQKVRGRTADLAGEADVNLSESLDLALLFVANLQSRLIKRAATVVA